MIKLSTREAAKRLGINYDTLAHYIDAGKVKAPQIVAVGRRVVHIWTEQEVEHVRKMLPKIANGRKTRYKKQAAVGTQHSVKKKTQPRAAVLHKSRKAKKR